MAIIVNLYCYYRIDVRYSRLPYVQADVSLEKNQFPLLAGIDPDSLTEFNSRQMGWLLGETEVLLGEDLSCEERASAEALADFCRLGCQLDRYYMSFIEVGDSSLED